MKKKIVLSGINFYAGGPLSVYKDCLETLSKNYSKNYEIIALVHKKELFQDIANIKFLEFSNSRKSWFKRLYYEYYYFKKLSKEIKPYLWLSMHDITPNVSAERRVVYCHNPMPFYKMSLNEMSLDYKLALFNLFYKFVYKINILKNDFVVVQQQWLRDEFCNKFLLKKEKVIVAIPKVKSNYTFFNKNKETIEKSFFYPTFPRVFKNIEIICEACRELENSLIDNFKVYITISGVENKYAKWIVDKYKDLKTVQFIGLLTREEVYSYYEKVDCLIFPSKIETWGLPITEFKITKKPILLTDNKYAFETIGEYDKVNFFNSNSKVDLAKEMKKIIENKNEYALCQKLEITKPFSKDWIELFEVLLNV